LNILVTFFRLSFVGMKIALYSCEDERRSIMKQIFDSFNDPLQDIKDWAIIMVGRFGLCGV
jgi:hypothetical protein